MTFNTVAAQAASDGLKLTGEAVTYYDDYAGTVSTYAQIQSLTGLTGEIGEIRWVCTLLLADVGEPRRGATVTDANRDVWELQDRDEPSNRWIATWTAAKQ